jgi:S-adenosylmethionine hydrolase
MTRPVIAFLTDFGPDSAAAICRGVMLSIAPDVQINDISHSVAKYSIRDGAFLLWCALPWMPVGISVAVVDPGVGTDRRPIAIRVGRGDILIGPDNGLLVPATDRLGGIEEVRQVANRELWLADVSSTFHGRDIFSPTGAHLARGVPFPSVGPTLPTESLVPGRIPPATINPDELASSVVYIDSFGNARLAGEPGELEQALGPLEPGRGLVLELDGADGSVPRRLHVPWQETFGAVAVGEPLLYADSLGLLALADNQGNIAARLGLTRDQRVRIRPA